MMALWVVRTNPGMEDSPLDSGLPDFASVQQRALEEDKLCLLYFATPYCFPCTQSEDLFKKNQALQEVLYTGYVPFAIDPLEEAGAALAHTYEVSSLPALVIVSAEGKAIRQLSSLSDPHRLIHQLERAYFLQEVPAAFLTSQQAKSNEEQRGRGQERESIYGLAYPDTGNWTDLLPTAKLISQEWNQGVWIQTDSELGQAKVVIGTFESEKEARTTQAVLQSWQRKRTILCTLHPEPIPLQSSARKSESAPLSEAEEAQP
jgi:hypothetical protein